MSVASIAVGRRRTTRRRPAFEFVHRTIAQPVAIVALAILALVVLVAIFAPWLAPKDPNTQDLANSFADPFSGHGLLGTDDLGRDILSRLIFSTRVAVKATSVALVVAIGIGVPLGVIAGHFGGRVDRIILRFTDAVMCFPAIILAMAIIAVMGVGLTNAMVAIGIVTAPSFLRITRTSVQAVRQETFVEASRGIGSSNWLIVRRHLLPNSLPPVMVQISLAAGMALLAEATLSFLGLGTQPPDASWGTMLSNAYRFLDRQPWMLVWPSLMIAITVLACNLLGDAARDALGRQVATADAGADFEGAGT